MKKPYWALRWIINDYYDIILYLFLYIRIKKGPEDNLILNKSTLIKTYDVKTLTLPTQ